MSKMFVALRAGSGGVSDDLCVFFRSQSANSACARSNHPVHSDTVGWVIRPVKTVGRITYIVLVQTLNHARSVVDFTVAY